MSRPLEECFRTVAGGPQDRQQQLRVVAELGEDLAHHVAMALLLTGHWMGAEGGPSKEVLDQVTGRPPRTVDTLYGSEDVPEGFKAFAE